MTMAAYPGYRESGLDWLGAVPDHWRLAPFWSLFRRTKRTGFPDAQLLSVYRDYGVIRKADRDDNFNNASEDLSTYQLVEPGDLAMNKMKAWQGSLGVSAHRGIVSPAYFVFQAQHADDPAFLHYLLRSGGYAVGFMTISKGIRIGQWDLDPDHLGTIPIPLPPLGEQRAIAAYLDRETAKIDALVEAQRRLIELLKEKRQAVISYAVTKGLDPSAPMKDPGVKWLGHVPAHWQVVPLKSQARLAGRIGYRGYTTEDIVDEGEGALAISPGNLRDGRIEIGRGTFVTWEKFHESPEIIVEPSDVVLVKTGSTYGKVAFFRGDAVPAATINPQMLLIKGAKCGAEYMFMSLSSHFAQASIEASNTGGTIPTITQEFVGNIKIVIPDTEEISHILESVRFDIEQIERLTKEGEVGIGLLQERRAALIFAAVTGKIDVRGLAPAEVQAA